VTVRGDVLVDSSVWVPYLRANRYAATMKALVGRRRLWLHSVVLLELYAGTANKDDKRDVDDIREAARRLERICHPTVVDLCLAGNVLAEYARREGRIRPRDHSHDLVIAIGAGRSASLLLTENVEDMTRWAKELRRRAHLEVRVARPPTES
jgi:predicted nucleic acid-binding protein